MGKLIKKSLFILKSREVRNNMKKYLTIVLMSALFLSSFGFAKGGMGPCLATCCLGPRVGLEMNENTDIRSDEWIGVLTSVLFAINTDIFMSGYKAAVGHSMNDERRRDRLGGPEIKAAGPKKQGGFGPMLASCCLGPRIGLEMNDGRKIRSSEYLYVIPLVGLIPLTLEALDAKAGVTMSEIAAEEGLDS